MSESVGHTLKPTGQAYRWTPSCLPSLKIYGFTVQMPWRLGFEGKDVELIHHFVSMGFRPQNTEGMCLKLFEYLKHCETQKWCIVNGFHCPVCLCSTFFVCSLTAPSCLPHVLLHVAKELLLRAQDAACFQAPMLTVAGSASRSLKGKLLMCKESASR